MEILSVETKMSAEKHDKYFCIHYNKYCQNINFCQMPENDWPDLVLPR